MSITNFINDINNNGLRFNSSVIPDGELHRFHIEDDKPNTLNGWYVFYPGELESGAYGCWKRNINNTWCNKSTRQLNPIERKRLLDKINTAKVAKEKAKLAQYDRAAKRAFDIFINQAHTGTSHPYAERKQVQLHDCQVLGDSIVVPVIKGNKVTSLQFIKPDGSKKFLYGGDIIGGGYPIGDFTDPILIAEGFATAATLHELTGFLTIVSFTCWNIEKIATGAVKDHNVIICADNDHKTDGNPGITKALQVSRKLGCRTVAPPVMEGVFDFNDLYIKKGADAVLKCLGDALNE